MNTLRRGAWIGSLVFVGLADSALMAQQTRAFGSAVYASASDSAERRAEPGRPRRRPMGSDSVAAANSSARRRLSSVVVSGKPGSLEVVSVPLPPELAQIGAVNFMVAPAPGVKLIGRTQGLLGTPDARPASLVFTVSAPASALAGRMRVASAFFDALSGETALEVPVEMTVHDVHRVELTLIDQLVGAKRGDVVTIRYRAVNFGNVADSVSLGIQLPNGWSVASGVARTIRLGVRGAQDGALRIWVPQSAIPGTQLIRVVATSGGAVVSAGDVRVEVENPFAAASREGPRLDVGSVVSSLQQGPTSVAYVGTLQGNLSDSVSVSASGLWRRDATRSSTSDLALLRLGVATLPPSASLTSPWLRVAAGLTGGTFSELTGNFVSGTGVSGGVRAGGWSASGTHAQPYLYGGTAPAGTSSGAIDEARVDRRVDSGTVFVMATHLVDPGYVRQLDAASVGATFGATPFGQLSSELGYRKFDAGEGLGWSGVLEKQSDGGSFTVRALHAPGGARAFARATDELASSANRRLVDWMGLTGGFWRTDDGSSTLGASSGIGWNAGPTFSLRPLDATVSVQARSSSLSVTGDAGGFGDRETGLATNAEVRRGDGFVTGSVTVGSVTRSIGAADGTSFAEEGNTVDARATIGTALSSGTLQFDASLQRYDGAVGMMPRQAMIGVRADHLAIPVAGRWHVYGGAEVQRLSFAVGGNPALTQRYNVTLPIGGWFEISAVAERNPFYTLGSNGRLGWLTAVRIDRSVALPRLVSPGETHTVYRDLNGNGRRDRGEAGVAGIVVNCGERTIATDSRGQFKCGSMEQFAVDARSIPVGWVAPSVLATSTRPTDVGLTPMTAVHVEVELVGVDTLRVRLAELSKLIVIARDSANQPWLARDLGAGQVVFDALPVGAYTIEVDASAIEEPLTAAERVTFRVGDGSSPKVHVALRGRSVKVRVLPPTQSDGAGTTTSPRGAAQSTGSGLKSKERD